MTSLVGCFCIYARLTPLVGCFCICPTLTPLVRRFCIYPTLTSLVGCFCICSLCLCQALVVVWGPGVITGSLCVLCVCARPCWWCGVPASSRVPCVFVVSVPGLGGGVGSRRHHGFPVCCVCARPWWWCGVPASSRVPCVLSSSSASADCPRPEARPSPWRSRTSKPGTRTKRRKRRGAKTCIRQQHKATAWRSRTSKPGTHRRRNRRRAKSRNRQRHKATELWPASRRRTLELPSITTAYRAAVFISCCLSQRQRESGKWSDNANGLKFLTIIVMKCL